MTWPQRKKTQLENFMAIANKYTLPSNLPLK